MNEIFSKVRNFASEQHTKVNHYYDNKYYHVHLDKVVEVAEKFIYLIPEKDRDIVIAACYCHDLLEDTRLTYNDLFKSLSSIIYDVASDKYFYFQECKKAAFKITEIVFALTNEKGRNRKERANDKYYQGIRDTEYAVFVKLCDRIANTQYSKTTKSKMFEMYKKEHDDFKTYLKDSTYDDMFIYLDNLVNENIISN